MEVLDNEAIERLRDHVNQVARINEQHGIPQENFVMEEASEFMKEYLKLQRDKSIQDSITSEAIDMFTALLVYFDRRGVNMWSVIEQADRKLERAITRYEETREV